MLKRVVEIASKVVCITALAVIVAEGEGNDQQRKQKTLDTVHQFRELWFSSPSSHPGMLENILFSEIVVSWLTDRLVEAANAQGLFDHDRT